MTSQGHDRTLLNWITIDRDQARPIYRQISDQLRGAILDGRLCAGSYLPASRVLAGDLGISRNTSMQVYDQLIAEGFLESRRGSGTRVSTTLRSKPAIGQAETRALFRTLPAHTQLQTQDLYLGEPPGCAFQPGIPAFDAFPRLTWARLLKRHALRADQFILDYAHAGGYMPLRQELAKYLTASRGVACAPEQILIVTSTRAAIMAVAALLWPRQSTVAVEDPGYLVAKRALSQAGHHLRLVILDRHGARVNDLIARPEGCVGVYLTPAHQWPTGVTLSASRRIALLDWAARTDAWVLEDDYDSEFRFDSPPVATLHSYGSGRVIHIGTFSKTLAPSLRTAYFVVPPEFAEQFNQQVFLHGVEPPLHVQAALADFLAEGHFARHIARMCKLYAKRRSLLIAALQDKFGDRLRLDVPAGGLQLIARLPGDVPASAIAKSAASQDLVARPMLAYQLERAPPNALHLGFAAVPEYQIAPLVARLHAAISHHFR
ncbi:PLP-dependent aminotransferase family protein [Paracoccus tegillarcae]|uniref:PLP-dependent aminotransferase family protein n=1 Tax=Paracoccus tegillarcae TaxID=1529068 RepID=A0A2K9EUI4_9RHOB|nr:PLP-dependent aminotransferase family protein [Paracoccus tegillarcae]AUH34526.1 PLP-dependent aminotransferase family protein [Paracoccus tegillarcae]